MAEDGPIAALVDLSETPADSTKGLQESASALSGAVVPLGRLVERLPAGAGWTAHATDLGAV